MFQTKLRGLWVKHLKRGHQNYQDEDNNKTNSGNIDNYSP